MSRIKGIMWIVGLIVMTSPACKDYLGEKTDLSFIDVPVNEGREVAFVPIQPVWDQFIRPVEIIVGFDELIYVVDAGAQQIISYDKAGNELGRITVQGVQSVTQTRNLELLAVGTKNQTISGIDYELACIYRIKMQNGPAFGIQLAEVVGEIVHPFYYKSTFSQIDAEVRFKKISALGIISDDEDHGFYVTRNGPNNNTLKVGGPDDAVLFFFGENYISPISVTSRTGEFYTDYFKKPSGISSLAKPPQITANLRRDFLYTSLEPGGVIKANFIEVLESEFGVSFTPREIIPDTSESDDYLTRPFKFKDPTAISISGDETGYIFVTDIESDSVYLFSNNGLEGVVPPAGSAETKYINVSFGGQGLGLKNLNNPMSVCYDEKILYVADAGNSRIVRYKLTTDFEQ